MHKSIMDFGTKVLTKELIENKIVLDIGSLDVNGSWKDIILNFNPKFYIGIDMQEGKNVDLKIGVENLHHIYPKNLFDLIISTETLEHIKLWKEAIVNMKSLLKVSGTLIITTRSKGCNYHPYPNDYWRYELEDIKTIFSDFNISIIEVDAEWPGVLMVAQKVKENLKSLDGINMFKVDKEYRGLSPKIEI